MKEYDKEKSIRHILADTEQSSFQRYKSLTVGDVGFFRFLVTEFVMFVLAPMPGALGIFLRMKVYPFIFKECGKGLIIGRNCVFRHPSKINIGNNVTIDDYCLIDARGTIERGAKIEDGCIINRGTIIQSKSGDIIIGKSVSIGANSTFVSWDGIDIGEGTAIAAGCYLSAGNYDMNDLKTPVIEQTAFTNGPIIIAKNVWIATRVTILDGVRIDCDSIISAGSVVTQNIPEKSVAHGNPAKVVFARR